MIWTANRPDQNPIENLRLKSFKMAKEMAPSTEKVLLTTIR